MVKIGSFIEGRYEILEKIGSGGMSEVYKARCHKLNRFVAIKFLRPEYCEDKNFISNFQIEAQSAAALLHPNVVSVYDVNQQNGAYYIVMEFVDGITLKKYIEINGKLPVREATSIAIQVTQGMEAAHNAGIVHRDIKPQNVLISREGKIKVTDFGIARTTTANTLSADILGSAQYISPEQARGEQVDARSDIYSFGIVFFEMLTGMLPFDGESSVAIALKHIQERVPLVSEINSNVPDSVVRIIEKCTQKKPDRRYQKVSSLISDLKTSLVTPDDDFVVLEPEEDESRTVIISSKDAQILRKAGMDADRQSQRNRNNNRQRDNRAPERRNTGRIREEDYYDSDYDEDEQDEHSKKKFDKILKYCGIAAGIIIIIVLIIVCINTFGGGCAGSSSKTTETTSAESVKMPDLSGKTLDQAESEMDKLNLKYTITYEESSDVKKDYVISQSVEAGAVLDNTVTVEIVISSGEGTELIELDDYTGQKQATAIAALKELGFQTSTKLEYSDEVEIGLVISTNPKAGAKVEKGGKVVLTISKGSETKTATVPQLVGTTESEARTTCESLNLVVQVNYQTNDSHVGEVINQSLTAGSTVDEGTTITLTVGKTSDKITIDNYSGQYYESVVSKLSSLGLSPATSWQYDDSVSVGMVISTSPSAGSSVTSGSGITVYVSQGPRPTETATTETTATDSTEANN